jgi:hypothetical protein
VQYEYNTDKAVRVPGAEPQTLFLECNADQLNIPPVGVELLVFNFSVLGKGK